VTAFSKTRLNHKGLNQVIKKVGGATVVFVMAETYCNDRLCWCIVMVCEPVVVLPLFQVFSTDMLPQMLQNLPVVMLVNHLAWRNKFLMPFQSKKAFGGSA
jgi:hypothetical protein